MKYLWIVRVKDIYRCKIHKTLKSLPCVPKLALFDFTSRKKKHESCYCACIAGKSQRLVNAP